MTYIIEILAAIIVLIIVINLRNLRKAKYIELRELAQETDNIPVISFYRTDDSVDEREKELNELIQDSGNQWGIRAISYPMLPSDENFGNYIVRVGKLQEKARNARHEVIKKQDHKAWLTGVLKQKLTDSQN
jgi:endonuclease V-like protein UPF0215 family